jgi:hypothetical protein
MRIERECVRIVKMKLANALLLLAIIATASALYLGRRGPAVAAPELELAATSRSELSSEVVRLRRELAVMKAKIALLQNDRAGEPRPATQASGSETSDE